MSVNKDYVSYASEWDIDQLVTSTSVAVISGDTLVYTLSGLPTIPVMHAQFQPTGSSKWFEEGTSSTDRTTSNTFTFYTYISGTSFRAVTTVDGIVRYFKWQDKVDY